MPSVRDEATLDLRRLATAASAVKTAGNKRSCRQRGKPPDDHVFIRNLEQVIRSTRVICICFNYLNSYMDAIKYF